MAGCAGLAPRTGGPDDPVGPAPTAADYSLDALDRLAWVRVVTDEAGDAPEVNTDAGAGPMRQACAFLPADASPVCREVPTSGEREGVPAGNADFLDVVSVDIQPTPHVLGVRLGLARLDDGFEQFVDTTRGVGSELGVVLVSGMCTNAVGLGVHPFSEGAFQAFGVGARTHDDCAPVPGDPLAGRCAVLNSCGIAVPVRVDAGSPGYVTWAVPRMQMAFQDDGEVLVNGVTERVPFARAPGGWLQPGTDFGTRQLSFDSRLWDYVVDVATAANTTLATPADPRAWGEPVAASMHEVLGAAHPDPALHIQKVTRFDNDTVFGWTAELASLPPGAALPNVVWQFTSPGKHHFAVRHSWVVQENETVAPAAGSQVTAERWTSGRAVPLGIDFHVEYGTPGRMTFELPRYEIAGAGQGNLTRLFLGIAQRTPVHHEDSLGFGRSYLDLSSGWGNTVVLPPYAFQTAPPASAAVVALELPDAVHDAGVPTEATANPRFQAGDYDLSVLELRGLPGDLVQLSLGVRTLEAVEVPPPYDIVVYGAGIVTPTGAYMVYVRKVQDEPPVAQCGSDRTFTTGAPQDPGDGNAPVTLASFPSSGEAPGLLVFHVPITCFGAPLGTSALDVSRVAARSGVIGGLGAAQRLTVVDEVAGLEGARLTVPQPEPPLEPAATFWAEPFGFRAFWDVFGAILAILTVAVSLALYAHRRRRLRRYLERVDQIRLDYADDPKEMQRQLAALYGELRGLLESGRLPTDHYGIVEQRLDRAYVRARLAAFGHDYAEVPHGVVVALERLVRDGEFSQADRRIALELLEKNRFIKPERKAELRKVLNTWTKDDEARLGPTLGRPDGEPRR